MKIQAPRGTHDILPAESPLYQHLERTARDIFSRFGFGEIRTPAFESLELFQRSLGETTDVIQKEMYAFEDRGGRKLALRPEGTAGAVRAYIEHHLDQTAPFCKLFYIGQMFRAENPQAGRFREFWQIGAESFGNASAVADAELILMVQTLFQTLRLTQFVVKINSLGDGECRPKYIEALKEYFSRDRAGLCEHCQRRLDLNPLRILDCKTDGPRFTDVPTVDAYWCDPCRSHFARVRELLDAAGAAYVFTPRLVRGLDYYTRTVFEVTSTALGAQDALAAGGRYDRLVKQMGGPEVPALGFALGAERLILALGQDAAGTLDLAKPRLIFVAAQGAMVLKEAFSLLSELRANEELRRAGFSVEGGFFEKKLGAQLGIADRLASRICLILGEDELQKGEVTVRDLAGSTQLKVPRQNLVAHLLATVTTPTL